MMPYKILLCKISDSLPSIGGALGAVTQAPQIISSPTPGPLFYVILYGVVGSLAGILTKVLYDAILKKYKIWRKCK
jgi:hypothetical protein